MTLLRALIRDRAAAAAAEMALVTPLLVLLLFACAEMGKYFLDEHVVVKAVRDGARYAARQQMDNFVGTGSCNTTPGGSVVANTQKLVRTGNVAGTGARLYYWTDDASVTVTSACFATKSGATMGGIYNGLTAGGAPVGAPVVTVTATVPYTSLFGLFNFATAKTLYAAQQAAVMGV